MAGIGFELRKLLEKDSYLGLAQAYAYAGIIGAGPWVLSIVGILLLGILALPAVGLRYEVTQFQVSVTWIMVMSLVLTGFVQLAFTRFIADRLFEKRHDLVVPNFNGVMLLVTAVSGVLGLAAAFLLFPAQGVGYRLLMLAAFVIMCDTWVAVIFLSGMKQYREIVGLFALGYAIVVGAGLALRPLGLNGLLLGFVLGHLVLLIGMMTLTYRSYPAPHFIGFEFLGKRAMYPTLMWAGFLYNLAIWADKLVFWLFPDTGQQVIGPLRSSIIYDLPVFLAYLSIIPGMAVFLVRIETDFVEYFDRFYDAVREGGSLDYIENMRDEMVYTIRQGLTEIVKIQSIAVLVTFIAGPALLSWLGISELYVSLLYVFVVAAALQVVLLGVLNIFFYLDKRMVVVELTLFFLLSNVFLSVATLQMGASFFGYGFAVSLLLTVLLALHTLDRKLESLEYDTFMLQ